MVAREPSGRVVFVRHGLPGERVVAELTEPHATWARADAVEVLEASPDRVAPPCPYAGPGRCGGCDYQHAALPAQRELKRRRLRSLLRDMEGTDGVAVEALSRRPDGLGTRTRVRFVTDARGALAMRRHGAHELVAVERCALAVAAIDALGLAGRALPASSEVEAVALDAAGPVTVRVAPTASRAGRSGVLEGPGLAARQRAVVDGLEFEVGPRTFWQVHERAAASLAAAVLDGLALVEGDRVLDGYCGAGLFAAVAARSVGRSGAVVGLDESAPAIADARRNLAAFPWASARVARVDAASVASAGARATHAVLDPPRRGVDRGALGALHAIPSLRRVVAVSCEPATLARDLRLLLDAGWRLASLRALDLFEQTEHLECVAVLERP